MLMILASFSLNSQTHDHKNCNGFLPENDHYIPVGYKSLFGGISQSEFNEVEMIMVFF